MTQSGLKEEHCDEIFKNLEVDSCNDTDFIETSKRWWHIRVKKTPHEIV